MNRCRRKKLENSFFSSSLFSFLPFRLDINEEKKENPLTYPATTINKWRKKEEAKEKKAQKVSSLTRRISLSQRRRREKKVVSPYIHTYKLSPLSITIRPNK
jgi:hypothetical protein